MNERKLGTYEWVYGYSGRVQISGTHSRTCGGASSNDRILSMLEKLTTNLSQAADPTQALISYFDCSGNLPEDFGALLKSFFEDDAWANHFGYYISSDYKESQRDSFMTFDFNCEIPPGFLVKAYKATGYLADRVMVAQVDLDKRKTFLASGPFSTDDGRERMLTANRLWILDNDLCFFDEVVPE